MRLPRHFFCGRRIIIIVTAIRVMKMVVYADILIITNLIVDYFLLKITAGLTKQNPTLLRQLSASFFAACGALVIFLPEQNTVFRVLFRLIFGYLICLICFGFKSFRKSVSGSLVFFAVTTCFAGAMLAIWYIFNPYGMVINNSVVYFNISPVFLIAFSVIGFLLFSVLSYIFKRRNSQAESCTVTLVFEGKSADFSAVIDSGNALTDNFTQSAVIIADRKKAVHSFGEFSPDIYPKKYRVIPCGTVSGCTFLDGYRCESGTIKTDERSFHLNKPIMAISKTPLCDCEALVNPLDCG